MFKDPISLYILCCGSFSLQKINFFQKNTYSKLNWIKKVYSAIILIGRITQNISQSCFNSEKKRFPSNLITKNKQKIIKLNSIWFSIVWRVYLYSELIIKCWFIYNLKNIFQIFKMVFWNIFAGLVWATANIFFNSIWNKIGKKLYIKNR